MVKDKEMITHMYAITGLAIRGYSKTYKQWTPKRYEVLRCIFDQGVVAVKKGNVNCGSVPTEIQEVSRKFIQAGGKIEAKVINKDPRYRGKGKEIPCRYIWSGHENRILQEAVLAARKAVAKTREKYNDDAVKFRLLPKEKRKILRKRSTNGHGKKKIDEKIRKKKNASTQCHVNGTAGKSGTSKAVAKTRKKYNDDTVKFRLLPKEKKKNLKKCSTNGHGNRKINENIGKKKNTSTHVNGTAGKSGTSKAIAKTRQNYNDEAVKTRLLPKEKVNGTAGKSGTSKGIRSVTVSPSTSSVHNQETMEENILLSSKNLAKLSQCINKNWEFLGLELGLKKAQIWQIREERPNSVELQIYHMLEMWNQTEHHGAYLHTFKKAIAECPKVGYQQPELNNAILKIAEDYKAQLSV